MCHRLKVITSTRRDDVSVAIIPTGPGANCSSAAPVHPGTPLGVLDAICPAVLECPFCTTPLRREHTRLTCPDRHSFDIARQGYVNLIHGHARHRGDTADMVAAREIFLAQGHYRPLAETVTVLAARHDPAPHGTVLDLAGGTGHYLASVLEAVPHRHGICLDASVPALKRAARAHPRGAAVGADAWQRWPLATGSASTVLNVFAPRNAAETRRVLAPAGIIITATPARIHLCELIEPLGMPTIDSRKADRLAATFNDFIRLDAQLVTYRLSLNHTEVHALVSMGPAARHASSDALRQRVARLPERVTVTVAVEVAVHVASLR